MKNISRTGKIARLPHAIREQLNLKLHDGLPAKSILPWLNSIPEVKTILAADFDSHPINKQNLSDWKQGGYRDWLLLYHASHFLQFADSSSSSSSFPPTETQDGADQPQDHTDSLTQHAIRNTTHEPLNTPHNSEDSAFSIHHSSLTAKLLLWTQLQYTAMARHIDAETDPERKWTALRQFANDISRLRRSTLADDFLQIQRDWLALSQSNSTEKKELEFCKWIKRPDIADAIKSKRRDIITREQLRKIEEEDLYLTGPDNPSLDEHIAQVHLARELMARRKAKEAKANRKPGDPIPEIPQIKLRETTFEELFPTIPDKPLTELDLLTPEPQSNTDLPVGSTHSANADSATCEFAPSGEEDSKRSDSLSSTGGEGRGEEANSSTANSPVAPPQVDQISTHPSDSSCSPALRSASDVGGSNPVKPSQTQSNQINPTPPPATPI